jgi:hypothetical protein
MNGSQEQDQQERRKPTLIAYSVKLNEEQARAGSCWWRPPWIRRQRRTTPEAQLQVERSAT